MSARRRKDPGHPAGLVVELDELRRAGEAEGRWPGMPDDRACGELGCLLKLSEHLPSCRVCGNRVEHHSEEACWEGLARMARARMLNGSPVSYVDVEAMDRHPKPQEWAA